MNLLNPPRILPSMSVPWHSVTASGLELDPNGEFVLRPITALKRRLDRVLNFRAWDRGLVSDEDIQWARNQGFSLTSKPSGTGVDPCQFAKWIVGPFRLDEKLQPPQLFMFPSWAAIGWNRRLHRADSFEQAQSKRMDLERDTIERRQEAAYSTWIAPLPMVVCGEGKHRADLYADYFDAMLTNLHVDRLPDASSLLIRRIVGAPRLVALQYTPPNGRPKYALLPFPDLSIPLLGSIGVKTESSPWLPLPFVTNIAIPGRTVRPLGLAELFHLERLRTSILDAGYV